jgi:4-amino-4-deoxy-L-arabinose transferase-like glycosyltransferase
MLLRASIDAPTRAFFALLVGIVALRIAGLAFSPLELHFDEAQYWLWSRELEWGYISKPPLIAWMIAASTALFGDAEWAVRVASPVAHGLGAVAIYALSRRIYGATAALWTGALWLTIPAVWVSSAIMSTDALVLPLWSAALYALWRLSETRSWFWASVLGLALGFGALAKYAMLFFVPCAGLVAILVAPVRRAILSKQGALATAIGVIVLAPNLTWNALNRFATVAHTAANANLGADLVHPKEFFEFLASQAGVVGPVLFLALIWRFWDAARRPGRLRDEDKFLLAFIIPPLLVILTQALISRAHANWAAAAYPAAVIWLVGRLVASLNGRRVLIAGLATQLAAGAFVLAIGLRPELGDAAGLSDSLKRIRGWRQTTLAVADRARSENADVVLVDHRALYFELAYYGRDLDLPPVRMWLLHAAPRNHAEAQGPMRPEDGVRALVVHSVPSYTPLIETDFLSTASLDSVSIPLGGGEKRDLTFAIGRRFDPAPRDKAFAARVEAARMSAN